LDEGDTALVPEPAYPAYNGAVVLAGGVSHFIPLLEENRYLPDFDRIPKNVFQKAKFMVINYPSNPLSAMADGVFYKKAVALAEEYGFIVVHDAAYSEMYFDKPPVSFLSVPGAKKVGVEFHSCSKTYNMTGWRIGWVCGHAGVVKGVGQIKENYDSGVFGAVQEAAIAALSGPQDCVADMRRIYKERRDVFVGGLKKLGWNVLTPPATFYVWAHVPPGLTSAKTAERLLEEAHIVCTPGNGFGPSGEGYVRFALTVPVERLKESLARIQKVRW
jgi:LL-diaminopimelate aminotransferase